MTKNDLSISKVGIFKDKEKKKGIKDSSASIFKYKSIIPLIAMIDTLHDNTLLLSDKAADGRFTRPIDD
ncbi:hypothetical protein [Butyricimonas faecihominis]|jgi:hypothetical protein|uniref:hypothetical protein n=1 Tax=Butyricimonas faecihominis TaxID=1472416 RepID=UPI002670A8F3|nr:hypothetical protein [Butyricimonas faecihominis]